MALSLIHQLHCVFDDVSEHMGPSTVSTHCLGMTGGWVEYQQDLEAQRAQSVASDDRHGREH